MQSRPRKKTASLWPDLVVSATASSDRILRATAAGQIKPLVKPFYSPAIQDDPATIIRRNVWKVVAALVPGAVISFRTALEARPATDGTVFVVSAGRYTRNLPGLQVRGVPGPGPQPDDFPFVDGLHLASRARAMLDALRPSRGRERGGGTVARGLSTQDIETWLEKDFQTGGEQALNRLRDEARRLVGILNATAELAELERLIGRLLGSRRGSVHAPSAIARLAGRPYDVQRTGLFDALASALQDYHGVHRPLPNVSNDRFATMGFFDAYFSNFIEGTEFEVDEARAIVFEQVIPAARPLDAHDILGTFAVVGHRPTMLHSVHDDASSEAFMERLRLLHGRILAHRNDARPGQYKREANRAGDTHFVAPEHVRGTLSYGFDIVRGLATPFQRAAAMMFVLSEVHPFDDGNGRITRALMNAELVAAGDTRIIIPTVFRDDYLTGLRTLSRAGEPHPFILALDFAQRWVAALDWSSFAAAEAAMTATHAFARPSSAISLRSPRTTEPNAHR